MLKENVAAGLDSAFFSTDAATAAGHAGLLNGLDPITASSVMGKLAMVEDLAALGVAVSAGGSGEVLFIMPPERLAQLRILAPEIAASIDAVPSAALPEDRIVACDSSSILIAVDDAPDIFASRHAAIHMSDEPLEIVDETGPTTADPVRSMWQTDSIGLRVQHDLAFAKRRAGAVAYCDSVLWS